MSIHRKKLAGFTLVELTVVIAVIAILTTIGVVAFNVTRQNAISSTMQSDLRGTASALKQYYLQNGSYPAALSTLDGGHGPVISGSNQYTYTPGASNTTYCLSISSPGLTNTFHVSSARSTPTAGTSCSGDGPPVPPVVATIASIGTNAFVTSSSSQTLQVPVPSGVTAGSLVVMMTVGYNYPNSDSVPVMASSAPSGFTLGQADIPADGSGNSTGVQWWYKYATGSDSGTYSISLPAGTVIGYAMRITGGPTSGDPFESISGTNGFWQGTVTDQWSLPSPGLMMIGYDASGYVTSSGWSQTVTTNESSTQDLYGILNKHFSAGNTGAMSVTNDNSLYGSWSWGSIVAIRDGTASAPSPPTPLVAYNFNEGSGSTSADKSGNSHTLTIANSSRDWSSSGHTGAGYKETSTNSDKATLTLGSGSISSWTEAFWLDRTGATSSSWGGIFDDGTAYLDTEMDNNNYLHLVGSVSSPNIIPLNTWTYVTFVVDGPNGLITLYLNGVPVSVTATGYSLIKSRTFTLGATADDPPANAVIDDFQVYGSVLNPSDIPTLMSTPVN